LARRVQPIIIIMDLSMPVTDGWEATRRLKGDPLTRNAFIVAVTAHAFPREHEAARAAGCDVVIVKPFELAALADDLQAVASHGLAAFGAKADVTAQSHPVTFTTGDASTAKNLKDVGRVVCLKPGDIADREVVSDSRSSVARDRGRT
jgi:DNA-binding response OmpR family regulator